MISEHDRRYLGLIRDAIELIRRRTSGSREDFEQDVDIRDAVLRRLETLSDAVSHLSSDLRERHPDIPWRAIGDFRNRLAHGYLQIKPERIRDVIVIDLPNLMFAVKQEIDRTERGRDPKH